MADLDWNALNAAGTLLAAMIALLAYRFARKATEAERARNAQQSALDAAQGASIGVLADAVRKMVEQRDDHIHALADRVALLEAQRDPGSLDKHRREEEAFDALAKKDLEELESRLQGIARQAREPSPVFDPQAPDRKHAIRIGGTKRAPATGATGGERPVQKKACPQCGTPVEWSAARCPECRREFA